MSKGGEKGRWMIGYPSHPRPPSTNIRVGGIYSYKLSAGASQEGARRGGFVSIKGIEVLSYSTSTLLSVPSFSLSLPLARQRPTCISRLCFSFALYHSFFRRSFMLHRAHSVSLKRAPDCKTNLSPATSFLVSPHPVSEPEYFAFCRVHATQSNILNSLLMVTSLFHGFSICLSALLA